MLAALDEIVTVGRMPSMMIALFALREFVAPGVNKVKVALLPEPSLIVPPLRARAEVDK